MDDFVRDGELTEEEDSLDSEDFVTDFDSTDSELFETEEDETVEDSDDFVMLTLIESELDEDTVSAELEDDSDDSDERLDFVTLTEADELDTLEPELFVREEEPLENDDIEE